MPRSRRSWCDTADWLSAEHRGEIADAELAVRERVEDADAGRIAEGAEGVGEPLDGVGRDQRGADLPDSGEVDLDQVADFVIFEHMSSCSYVRCQGACQKCKGFKELPVTAPAAGGAWRRR